MDGFCGSSCPTKHQDELVWNEHCGPAIFSQKHSWKRFHKLFLVFLWDFVPFNFVEHLWGHTDSGREGLARNLCSSSSSSGVRGVSVRTPHQSSSSSSLPSSKQVLNIALCSGPQSCWKRLKCFPQSVATKPEAFKCPKCFGEALRLLVSGDQGVMKPWKNEQEWMDVSVNGWLAHTPELSVNP